MTWFRVDDSFPFHSKVIGLPDCAKALWLTAGAWSAGTSQPGFVPSSALVAFCGDPDTATEALVARGLWERASGGFRFHDWEVYNFTADEVAERKQKRAEAGRLGGLAKARAKQSAGNDLASASHDAKQNPAPNPTPNPKKTKSSSSPPATDSERDFARFWDVYPRHIGKVAARKSWTAALRKAPVETIIEAAGRYAAERGNQDPKYTAHPATWLNQERWEDQVRPAAQQTAIVWPWEQ